MTKFYPLARPLIEEAEKQAVFEVLDSKILSFGPKIKEFEKKFSQFIGTKYACAVSSGTAGLHLTMLAAGIGPGDEVITSPFSFAASANSILFSGAKPVFADIDPVTYNIDTHRIEEKITNRTRAILVVHIFGQTCQMDKILEISQKHNLIVIEDACEVVGAQYKGKKAGTFGQSAVFAFYGNKQLVTGEGGMITTNNQQIDSLCRSLRNQGRDENMAWLNHARLGYNYRLTEMQAALGLAQLEKLNWMIKERQRIAGLYHQCLKPFAELLQIPHTAPDNIHSWFLYVVRLNQKISRSQIIEQLKQNNIQSKPYFPSIHLLDFYQKMFNYREGNFPESEEASRHTLALPFYVGLNEKDVKYISQKLIDLCRNNLKAK